MTIWLLARDTRQAFVGIVWVTPNNFGLIVWPLAADKPTGYLIASIC
jgi:hypothetical protein